MAIIATVQCLFDIWEVILLSEKIVKDFVQESESVLDFEGYLN